MTKLAIVRFLDEDSIFLRDMIARYLLDSASRNCPAGLAHKKNHSAEFAGFIGNHEARVSDITPERADAFRLFLVSKGYATNTQRHRLEIIKSLFQYGLRLGLVQSNPFINVPIPPLKFPGRAIPEQELRKIIRQLPAIARRMVKLALYTGMRRGEICSLEWDQIGRGFILIPAHKSKTRKERIIFLNTGARRALGKTGTGSVFGRSKSYINTQFVKARKALGIKARFHDLRHTASARHYERNRDAKTRLKTFGWSPGSDRPYDHISAEVEKREMQRLTYRI